MNFPVHVPAPPPTCDDLPHLLVFALLILALWVASEVGRQLAGLIGRARP